MKILALVYVRLKLTQKILIFVGHALITAVNAMDLQKMTA